jgi:hypothetical protein
VHPEAHTLLPYVGLLTHQLQAILGSSLRAVYLTGSAAAGAYREGFSDVDVLVLSEPADRRSMELIVERCSHERLPCPARKLELVVYEPAAVRNPGERPRWSLNFNTGAAEHHVGFDPGAEPSHWFVLDLAFARRHALAQVGPPAAELIGDPSDAAVRAAFRELVDWYERNEPAEAERAARRARHWEATGEFAPKPA